MDNTVVLYFNIFESSVLFPIKTILIYIPTVSWPVGSSAETLEGGMVNERDKRHKELAARQYSDQAPNFIFPQVGSIVSRPGNFLWEKIRGLLSCQAT